MTRWAPGKPPPPGSRSPGGVESCFHTCLIFHRSWEPPLTVEQAGSRELPRTQNLLHRPGSASQVIRILPRTLWMALSAC